MLIESAKTTFVNYNSTKRINNCNVKLNIPWFGDQCKHARKKYKLLKDAPNYLEQPHQLMKQNVGKKMTTY